MTFICELDPHLVKMYPQTKNKLSASGPSKVIVLHTVAALHQGAPVQMTWLEDPPPRPMTRLEDLLCFGNECEQKIKMLPYLTALFVLFWQWNNQRRGRPVFWGQRLKKVVNFFWGKSASGDLAWEFSDLEMTWIIYCAAPHDLPRDLSDLEMTWLPWLPGATTDYIVYIHTYTRTYAHFNTTFATC